MVTLKDIAGHVGISVSAVSMALRDHGSIAEETKRKVWAAKEELGYRVKSKPSGNIAFVLFDRGFEHSVYAQYFQVIGEIVARQKMQSLYFSLKGASFLEDKLPPVLQSRNVDGIIASGLYGEEAHRRLQSLGIPLVALGNYHLGTQPWAACEVDMPGGIRLILAALAEHGHRRVGLVVRTSAKREYGQQIRQTFLNSLSDFNLISGGIEDQNDYQLDTPDGSTLKSAAKALLQRSQRPTALITETANIHIYDALEELGLRTPRDVSVIALGSGMHEMRPSLAAVATDLRQIARGAFEKLRRLIEEPETPLTREVFFMNLIPGGSFGPAPGN